MDAEVVKEVVEKKVYEDGANRRGRYATQGEALGVGIPALVLGGVAAAGMLFGRNRFGLGNGTPENVNIVNGGSAGSSVAPSVFNAFSKECEDVLGLTKSMYGLKIGTMQQMFDNRERDTAEKFSLFKSQVDGDFGLYKSMRDLYDNVNERYAAKFNDLDKKVAVLEAVRPYQDRLIQCEIDRVAVAALNYTDRKTCRMIEGQVVLPSTPTVTGYGSYRSCGCPAQTAAAPAAA
ncbi:MAG: hypothetical protein NC048_10420 [Bacteroides sp.]|nr:hypothetical protein [Bacteroides sp.]